MEMGIIKMVWVSKYMSRNTEFRNVKIVIELFVAFNYHILILKSTCCGIKVKNRPLKWFRHWARPELKLASQWWWLHWFYVSSLLGMGKHTRYYSLPLQLLPCSLPFLFFPFIFTLFLPSSAPSFFPISLFFFSFFIPFPFWRLACSVILFSTSSFLFIFYFLFLLLFSFMFYSSSFHFFFFSSY